MPFKFKFPDIGEGTVDGEIVRWLIQKGEKIQEDQPLLEVMTDKVTVEISSPVAGRILERIGEEGELIEVGAILVVIETPEDVGRKPSPAKPTLVKEEAKVEPLTTPKAAETSNGRSVLATPAIRKLAKDSGIDIREVEGSGPGGRVIREDLEHLKSKTPAGKSELTTLPASPGEIETIPYRGVRRKVGNHMVTSKNTAAHYTYVEEVDATKLVHLRQKFLASPIGMKSRLTYLPFLMKAVVEGLKKYPLVNSTLDEENGVIQVRKYYNLGIAVATSEGLVIPVVRKVDQKSILELAQEIENLSATAREGRLKLEDLKNSTFTITSLGVLGGVFATPIINYPEVAILGVHKISQKPVVREDRIVIRDMMHLSLSLDHRVLDGEVGARFLHHSIAHIESPELLSVAEGPTR